MRIFSKIPVFFLALAVVFSSFNQVQNSTPELAFQYSEGNGTPLYMDVSSRMLWGIINLDSSSTLLSVPSYTDLKEDKKSGSEAELALESALERFSSIYLYHARDIESSPPVRELLYPFHFYF